MVMVMVVMVMVMVVKRQTAKTEILRPFPRAQYEVILRHALSAPAQIVRPDHALQPQRHLRGILDQLVHILDQLVHIGEGAWPKVPKGGLDDPQDGGALALFPTRKHEDLRRSHVSAQLVLKTLELLDAAPRTLELLEQVAPRTSPVFCGHDKVIHGKRLLSLGKMCSGSWW